MFLGKSVTYPVFGFLILALLTLPPISYANLDVPTFFIIITLAAAFGGISKNYVNPVVKSKDYVKQNKGKSYSALKEEEKKRKGGRGVCKGKEKPLLNFSTIFGIFFRVQCMRENPNT